MTQTQTHSAGVAQAATIIHGANSHLSQKEYQKWLEETIDEQTRNSEMLAFIDEVIEWDTSIKSFNELKQKAFELREKVRG